MLYFGFYKGVITNIEDPEKRGRIKCIIPEVLGDDIESAWCEPCVPIAYDNGGDFCLPHKKETVWITFEQGDPNYPVYLGGWWQEKMTPLGDSYKDKEKVRIINFADCSIIMKDNILTINVGSSDSEITVKEGKIAIKGNVTINGNASIQGETSIKGNVSVDGNITCRSLTSTEI